MDTEKNNTKEKHVKEIQGLVDQNLTSFKEKVDKITRFMEKASVLIAQMSEDQDALALKLRDMLARKECLRKTDFDSMYFNLKARREQNFERVTSAIKEYRQGEYQMIDKWRDLIHCQKGLGFSEFQESKTEMFREHDRREVEVVKAIKNYHLQQEEHLEGMKSLVAKGDQVRISDFKGLLSHLNSRVIERETDMGQLLDEIREAAHVVRDDWDLLLSAFEAES